ncbi:MAG: aspartate carbamoyltransferase regulatory subunit [Chlorobi bacterium]|nr:aspartate carbamoyltransferase regulatory subunit [Chlorobiota bacterium]
MSAKKQLSVSAIRNGTVIDHIPATSLFNVISILNLEDIDSQITFGTNLESKKFGKKAIIKVSEVFFSDKDINKIALVAPQAKLSIIRDYEVMEKHSITIPDSISGIVKCVNPQCITNHENVPTRFAVVSKHPVKLKCHYCEKITDEKHLVML